MRRFLLFVLALLIVSPSFAALGTGVGPTFWRSNAPLNRGLTFYAPYTSSVTPQKGSAATFTRASSGTYLPLSGTLTTALSNAARIGVEDTGNTRAGVLIEGAATNLILRSAEFDNASWTKTRSSVSANASAAPDGATAADKLVEDSTANASHYTQQSFTASDGTTVTASVYAKAGERTWIYPAIIQRDAATVRGAYFNLSAGTAGSADTGVTASILPMGSGWYRCSITVSVGTGASSPILRVHLGEANSDNSFSGDGSSGLSLWGAQVEAASVPSSYVATAGTTVTRAKDVLTYSPTGNISFSAGTASVWVRSGWAGNDSVTHTILDTRATAGEQNGIVLTKLNTNNLTCYTFGATGNKSRFVAANGTNWAANTWHHVAMTWTASDGITGAWLDGVSISSTANSSYAAMDAVNTIHVGERTSSTVPVGGLLSRLRIYNRVLSSAEISTLYNRGL